jgi:non-ribosomal peptide synthetase component E (peptide arylation enzyme)
MRAVVGLAGLVVALAVVGVLARKQLSAVRTPVPSLQTAPAGGAPASAAQAATVRDQSQQIQQQVKQQMEGLMQQARPMPDDEK